MLRRIFSTVLLLCAIPFAAFAQTYPSQPTFQKCGVGLGPNTTELVTLYGGATPFGACWMATTTAGDGGFVGYVLRSTNSDPAAKLYFTGVGTWGSGVTYEKTEFYVGAPYGNPIEIFTDEGGTTGVLSLGVGGGVDHIEARTLFEVGAAGGIGANMQLFDGVTVSPVNEEITRFNHNAGVFSIQSLTDAGGAGQTLFTADRDGVNWQDVSLTAQLGSLTLTGQSQATLTSNVSTTVSASTGDINITGNSSSNTRLSGSGTLRLGTDNTTGHRILFDDNTGESIDYDIRGALGNTAGNLQVFTRTDFLGGIRNADGSAATPSYSFTSDTNTGLYSSSADHVGVTAAGTLAVDLSAAGVQVNGSCNSAGAPCYAFVSDPDTGLFRNANNVVGLVAGGTDAFDCSSTTCTANGNLTVTGTLTATGGGSVFGCYVDDTASAERCPSGWSVAKDSTGNYTVTYPFTLSNANDMAVSCTILAAASQANCALTAETTTTFSVETVRSDTVADSVWMFTAYRIN